MKAAFDAAYAIPEMRADLTAPQPQRQWLLERSPAEHEQLRTGAEQYLRESLSIKLENKLLEYQISFPDYDSDPPTFPTLLNEGAYFTVRIESSIPKNLTGNISLAVASGDRPDFILEIPQSGGLSHLVISPGNSDVLFRVIAADKIETSSPGIWSIFWLGFSHVIPDGLDHMLFILGLFLMARKWQPLLMQSLMFTLAHSISLGLAVAGVWQIHQWPVAWLIEPLIALSIAAIAVENLFRQEAGKWRLITVFVFGLIHGLGFAGSLGVALHGNDNWLTTLAIANLGVEAAQVALLAGAWLITMKWWDSENYQRVRIAASVVIGLTGLWWTVERLVS